jgi:lipopolysaccharide biosynthesis regulator YciM
MMGLKRDTEMKTARPLYWFRCEKCGWEHRLFDGMAQQCSNCSHWDTLHIISNRDGEMPKSDIFGMLRDAVEGDL